MSNDVLTDQVRMFSRQGYPVAEFRASVERSWVIGDESRAALTYANRETTGEDSVNTSVVSEKAFQFGNWLLVENDLLPPWIGVIDTPREWGMREVHVCAYSPEYVFGWRRGPIEKVITASAGTIFERLLMYVNQAESTIITKGDIWRGGKQREETINPMMLNEYLAKLFENSGEEYQWRPFVKSNNNLIVYADWLKAIGADTNVILQEGLDGGNVEWNDRPLIEDGPIINDLLGFGEGATWKDKPIAIRKDIDSRREYGLRQSSEEYYNVTAGSALENNVRKRLNEFKNPSHTFSLNALNVGETWRYCRLGNTLTLRLMHAGFDRGGAHYEATVRIIGMRYDPAYRNKLDLVAIEV